MPIPIEGETVIRRLVQVAVAAMACPTLTAAEPGEVRFQLAEALSVARLVNADEAEIAAAIHHAFSPWTLVEQEAPPQTLRSFMGMANTIVTTLPTNAAGYVLYPEDPFRWVFIAEVRPTEAAEERYRPESVACFRYGLATQEVFENYGMFATDRQPNVERYAIRWTLPIPVRSHLPTWEEGAFVSLVCQFYWDSFGDIAPISEEEALEVFASRFQFVNDVYEPTIWWRGADPNAGYQIEGSNYRENQNPWISGSEIGISMMVEGWGAQFLSFQSFYFD